MSETGEDASIERTEGPTGGRYKLDTNGEIAEMTFSRASAKLIIIDHTGVPEPLRGQGIGERLVARAVADARSEGFKIVPLCTFAAAQFRRHEDFRDVLSR